MFKYISLKIDDENIQIILLENNNYYIFKIKYFMIVYNILLLLLINIISIITSLFGVNKYDFKFIMFIGYYILKIYLLFKFLRLLNKKYRLENFNKVLNKYLQIISISILNILIIGSSITLFKEKNQLTSFIVIISIFLETFFIIFCDNIIKELENLDETIILNPQNIIVKNGKLINENLMKWGKFPWHKNGIYRLNDEKYEKKIYPIINLNKKKKKINNITIFSLETQQLECPICYENLHTYVKSTNCYHNFHEHCLRKWYKTNLGDERNPNCPICRLQL